MIKGTIIFHYLYGTAEESYESFEGRRLCIATHKQALYYVIHPALEVSLNTFSHRQTEVKVYEHFEADKHKKVIRKKATA